ncbi:MAG: CopG family transcriptional regulator [Nitrospirae bacterium]|nr:CopG family transcriptional regulator [Nitrospirota bacterium]
MKTVKVNLPEKLAIEVENYVKGGWFSNESEVIRVALQEFIRRHRFELIEKFMKQDIEWALKLKKAPSG